MIRKILLMALISVLLPVWAVGGTANKKPQWLTKGTHSLESKRSNDTYHFLQVKNMGPNLQQLQERKIRSLTDKIVSENKLEGVEEVDATNTQSKESHSTITYIDKATNQRKTMTFYYKLVDEYWEWDGSSYDYYALFAVADSGKIPVFDDFSTSSIYGAAPVVMSIIPGVGQMYKGSTVKGVCLLGGAAALGVGALLCENQRADYHNKTIEQPKFAKDYNTKANNWETARNVCLGVAAAVWVYNIVDAAIAKGSPRIVVKPGNGPSFSLRPMLTPEGGSGLTLAYTF